MPVPLAHHEVYMKKESIIQFVGFITNLDFDEFVPKWEEYAQQFNKRTGVIILQQLVESKCRYKYVSRLESPEAEFRFAFMKGRSSEHFPEHKVKVAQAGGYTPVRIECNHHDENGDDKVMAFISHNEDDIGFYTRLSMVSHLNIYKDFYESCTYAYIMEFFTQETETAHLLQQLKTRTGVEAALYKECQVPHA